MCLAPSGAPECATGFSFSFPPDPVWVRACRQAVRASVGGDGSAGLAGRAVLLVSEAATNAICACVSDGCGRHVTVQGEWLGRDGFRVHVHDVAPGLPGLVRAESDAESGRGMFLIGALAARHGVCREGPGPGKSVWFQVGRGDR